MSAMWRDRFGWHKRDSVARWKSWTKGFAIMEAALTKRRLAMSWSASVSNVVGEDAIGELQDTFAKTYPNPTPEVAEQFASAIEAVGAVLLSVQPEKLGLVMVSASGHANPGHRKTSGWGNDTLTVTITQV